MKETGLCAWCGAEYIKTRSDKMTCSKRCSTGWSNRSELVVIRRIKRIEKEKKIRDEVKSLLMEFKRKAWYIDHADIFKLINTYDKVFPDKSLPKRKPELIFIKMTGELIDYLKLSNLNDMG